MSAPSWASRHCAGPPPDGGAAIELHSSACKDADLLTEVTDFTITKAIRQHAGWRDQGGRDLRGAVNLAPLIRDTGFPERLLNSLRQCDVPPSQPTLELKETENGERQRPRVMRRCAGAAGRAGIGLALDDYGAGVSLRSSSLQTALHGTQKSTGLAFNLLIEQMRRNR